MTETHCAGCGKQLPPPKPHAHRLKWCSDRCRKAQYAGACIDCGSPTHGGDGRNGKKVAVRCRACSTVRTAAMSAERGRVTQSRVEELWAQGLTATRIAEILGWKMKNPGSHISMLRTERGYNLPHRYSAEHRAHMAVGVKERMAKARAVYAAQREAARRAT